MRATPNAHCAALFILSLMHLHLLAFFVPPCPSAVAGATDGIGKGLCFELARRGLNVVLVSRSLTKLNEVADELTAKYPKVSTKVVAVDFSNFDAAAQGKVRSVVESLEVGTLINNVGMSYPYPTYFHELSHGDVQAMIALNVTSTTIMTHLVLPSMVQRKRGAIVCISSAASQLPANPLLAQYAAAKAYVDKSVGGKRMEGRRGGRKTNKPAARAFSSSPFSVSDIARSNRCFFFPCPACLLKVR